MTILFYEDFENEEEISENWARSGKDGEAGVTTEQVRCGSQAYKFSLTSYNEKDYREELEMRSRFNDGSNHFTIGKEYWVGFSFFVADGFHPQTECGSFIMHHQYHAAPDKPPICDPEEKWRNPVLTLQTGRNGLRNVIRSDPRQCTPKGDYAKTSVVEYGHIQTGRWVDYVINMKWSYGDDGFTKIWRDGVLMTDDVGGNCFNDVRGPYMKIGIYGWLDHEQNVTMYYDELRIGDHNSSYDEVKPGAEEPVPVPVDPPYPIPPEPEPEPCEFVIGDLIEDVMTRDRGVIYEIESPVATEWGLHCDMVRGGQRVILSGDARFISHPEPEPEPEIDVIALLLGIVATITFIIIPALEE